MLQGGNTMKIISCLTAGLIVLSSAAMSFAKTIDEYAAEAAAFRNAGQIDKAIATMTAAVDEHPGNSQAYTQLGIYMSEKAQRMPDFMELMQTIEQLFGIWDKALMLDENNVTARFYRAAWAVNVPKFFGQLETGVRDFEIITVMLEQAEDTTIQAQLLDAYDYLATGYQRLGEYERAKQTWNTLAEKAPGSPYAQAALDNIVQIEYVQNWLMEQKKQNPPLTDATRKLEQQVKNAPQNTGLLLALGKAYYENGWYEESASILTRVLSIDSENVDAYKQLCLALINMTDTGYDPRIALDTDFRTDLAFVITGTLDQALALAPDDIDLRFLRGVSGVQMPFFVGALNQGIDDLFIILESDAPDTVKAEAHYWIGKAYEKKTMTNWIEVVSAYPDSRAAQMVFDDLKPTVKRLDPYALKKPVVTIDFLIGFRDELAPQTAVWVEDADGTYITTVYVSGFSGHAKAQQVNLPVWAQVSEYRGADAVTAASIDLGHHVYTWDLKDLSGTTVKPGEYKILVEVAFWPSMQYQRAEAMITLGKKDSRTLVQEGDLIPYLEVKYLR
jgi:tetratricopeptide (TPR) repeat protein